MVHNAQVLLSHVEVVDPEQVADQLDDIVGTFYTYTLPAALVPAKMQKGGK